MIDESCLTSTDDWGKTLIQVGFQFFSAVILSTKYCPFGSGLILLKQMS